MAVSVSGQFQSDDAETVVEAALAGVGVIMATDWLVGHELEAGRMVPVLSDWTVAGETGVSVVRASAQYTPTKTRAFVEWIVQVFEVSL